MPSFSSFVDTERVSAELNAKKKLAVDDCIHCPKCKNNTWFEEVRAQQFSDDHQVIIGQAVPSKNGAVFVLLRCVKCQELIEPRLLRQSRDAANQLYENFLDSMKAPEIKTDKV